MIDFVTKEKRLRKPAKKTDLSRLERFVIALLLAYCAFYIYQAIVYIVNSFVGNMV